MPGSMPMSPDFLTRARERGLRDSGGRLIRWPSTACAITSRRRRNRQGRRRELAYAYYVLARNGAAPVGDLRYIADVKLGDIATPIGKAQIAAALGMLGDKERSDRVYLAGTRCTRTAA